MKLRDIDFGPIIGASGVQGIFGEGYPFHKDLPFRYSRGFDFDGMTFTAKTVTLEENAGNMPLMSDGLTPIEKKPKCIHVTPWMWLNGVALNAVGLSNRGTKFYLDQCRWQKRADNFFISFMSLKKDKAGRLEELKKFVEMLMKDPAWPFWRRRIGLQINFSCPNVGLHLAELLSEIEEALEIASVLGIPLVPKINMLVRPEMIRKITESKFCDGICVSNTLPWRTFKGYVDWDRYFKSEVSPLQADFKMDGGLSGKPLFPLLLQWLREARGTIRKPIIAGGGILSPNDIRKLANFPNVTPSLGSISFLRWWRIKGCIRMAHHLF